MKILITGATGMVGRNCVEYIEKHNELRNEHHLLIPDLNELNLLNAFNVQDYLKKNRPEFIIHAAGLVGGIQANIKNPVRFLVENYEMGKNLLMGARDAEIFNVMNLGSSCMYPRNIDQDIKEEMVLKGELEPTNEGYAIAKVAVARLCQYISQEDSRFKYKTIIPCNLYGRFDKFAPEHSHMIPGVIRKVHEAVVQGKNEIDIWGDGEARREFMFAEDLADFIFYAIDKFESMPPLINCGLGFDYTINEYYKIIAEVIGFNGKFVHDLTKPVGMKRKLVNVDLLKNFGWQHKIDLKSGIKETYKYFCSL